MRWAELVLDYLRVLVWPVLVLTVLVLLREPLRALLPRASKAEFLGVSLEFTAEAAAVGELAHRLRAVVPARPPAALPDEPAPRTVDQVPDQPHGPGAQPPYPSPPADVLWARPPVPATPVTQVGYGQLPGWSSSGSYGYGRPAVAGLEELLGAWARLTASSYAVLREAGVQGEDDPQVRAAEVLHDLGALDASLQDLAARTAPLVRRLLTGTTQETPLALLSLTTATQTLVAAFDAAADRLATPAPAAG